MSNTTDPTNESPRPEAEVSGRPPEGAIEVRKPPLGASWMAEYESFTSVCRGTTGGFPLLQAEDATERMHAGSLEARRVARPKAVDLERIKRRPRRDGKERSSKRLA